MRLFADYQPKQRRNFLWMVFTMIIVLLAIIIVILFNSIIKSNSILLMGSGLLLIILIVFTYILALRVSHWQYYAEMSKNDFTNNVVHEIKTPITVISLACEMLQDKNIDKDKTREEQVETYLPIITSETERLKKMVDVFLQHSRIDSTQFSLSVTTFDIHELITDLIGSVGILVESNNGQITASLNATNHTLEGDKVQITNVLTNIIDNGVKYSDKQPKIDVSTHDDPHGIVIRIADNGIGMQSKDLDHIFEKFYRVNTGDRHNVKGYGIGLNYALRIVEMHGGSIRMASTPGKGSVFMVFLPTQLKKRR